MARKKDAEGASSLGEDVLWRVAQSRIEYALLEHWGVQRLRAGMLLALAQRVGTITPQEARLLAISMMIGLATPVQLGHGLDDRARRSGHV